MPFTVDIWMERRTTGETQNDMLRGRIYHFKVLEEIHGERGNFEIICCKHRIYYFKVSSGVCEERGNSKWYAEEKNLPL